MSNTTVSLTPRQKRLQKAERAKKLLKGIKPKANTYEEDDEDTWEWIYQEAEDDDVEGEDLSEDGDTLRTPSKRKKRQAVKNAERKVIGAKRGYQEYHVGDTVFLNNDTGKDWVGIVFGFFEDESEGGEMSASFLCKFDASLTDCRLLTASRVYGWR